MEELFKTNFVSIATFAGTLIGTIIVASLVNRFFQRLIRKSTADQNTDPTNYKFLRHTCVAIVYILGTSVAIYSVPSLRALASSLLAGAGILAVAVGFASQQALSNVVSGVFIIIFKPYRVNDRVSVRGLTGIVEDITLRHTVIRDFENKRIIIPNAVISDEIIVNSDMFDDRACKFIDVGISYDSDIDLAKMIVVEEIEKHPFLIDARTPEQLELGVPLTVIRVISLGDSSVNIRAFAWVANAPNGFVLQCDLLESIKKRFDTEGIEIPFPHRTLVMKGKKIINLNT